MSEIVKEQSNKIVEPYTHKAWRMLRKGGYAIASLALAQIAGSATPQEATNLTVINAKLFPQKSIVWNIGGGSESNEWEELRKLNQASTLVSLPLLYSDTSRIYNELNKDGLLYDPRIEGVKVVLNDKGLFEQSIDFPEDGQWHSLKFQETGRAIFTNFKSGETSEFYFGIEVNNSDGESTDVRPDYLPPVEGVDEKFLREMLEAYKKANSMRNSARPILDGEFLLFLNEMNSPDAQWDWVIGRDGTFQFQLYDNMTRYGKYSVEIGNDKSIKSEHVQGAFVYAQDSIWKRKDDNKEYSSEWPGNRPT